MRCPISIVLVATALCVAVASPSGAMVTLREGRAASFKSSAGQSGDRGTIRFARDPNLRPWEYPIGCPTAAPTLRIRSSAGYDSGDIVLPCERWASAGLGFRYRDKEGTASGVRDVYYGVQTLRIRLKGEHFTAPVGPLGDEPFIEVYFHTGDEVFCGRYEELRRHDAVRIAARRGTAACRPVGPNIVLILGDDVDWRRLAFLGEDPRMLTPSLDKLADEGVTFPAGHLSTSLCYPMHQHMLTGVHPESSWVPTWRTLPREMHAAGRRTFQAGKLWDMPGFLWGFEENAGEVCTVPALRCGDQYFGRDEWDVESCGILGDPQTPCPATQEWRDFLGTLVPHERFFAFVTPWMPHLPFNPPQEYIDLYTGQPMSGPEPHYLPAITWFDGLVGEVVADLESAGLRDDTLVVYVADNGYRSDAPIDQGFHPSERGKGSLNEMGMRSPLVLSWPGGMGTTQGSLLSGVVGLEDLFATLLAVAGRPVPSGVQGHDLSASWETGAASPRQHIVTHFVSNLASGWVVRTEQWRYIRDEGNGTEHLYAIDVDPDEENDLIGSATPQQLAEFEQMIQDWRAVNE